MRYLRSVVFLCRSLIALLAGGLMFLAFPTFNVWVAAPLSTAALALVLTGTGPRRGLVLGLIAGSSFFLPSLHWSGIYVGPVPWVALSLLEALFLGLAGALYGWLSRAGAVRPVAFALVWVVVEGLRSRTPYGGFPWLKLAFSQADSPFGRLVAIGGTPFVAFIVALTGALVGRCVQHVLLAHRGTAVGRHTARTRAVVALGAVAGLSVSGYAVALPLDGPTARLLGVQGNVPQPGLDFNAERRAVLDNHVEATLRAQRDVASGRTPRPDLVVWPENASDIDPLRNADARSLIDGTVAALGVPLIVGGLLEEPEDRLSNVSLLFEPGRGNTARYVKQHPVPFAEYIPNRDFWRTFSKQVDLVRRDIVAGDTTGIFTTAAAGGSQIRAGLAICFEVAYDALMRDAVEQGANVLVVQTNNATFGFTAESAQQLAISRIRAMEFGRAVVHISTVGQSALIKPDGTATQTTALFTQQVIQGDLPLREQLTLAARLGDLPEWSAVLTLAALVAWSSRPLSRQRRAIELETRLSRARPGENNAQHARASGRFRTSHE
ncbi:acyltransferase [Intrasporangium chromatireducens Q5-1]|uniref:Apolipoprotein N-acyltransferase n=2 Tax=Intrasporangium TaxID=53357 RepID=W9GV56_9MICO|nr:acyltransferase [Intrasporangium chromatireducens Q5-1]